MSLAVAASDRCRAGPMESMMYETALVALDLSPAEQPLLDCLPDLRRWGVGRVVLTHVIRVGYMQGAGYGSEPQYVDEIASRVQPLREAGFEVEIVVRAAGIVADEILAIAPEKAAGLIVIGSRSRNMARGLFLGSVARDVIRKTDLPLLLEWIEPTAEATAARCEAVCRESLRHPMLATDFSRHARAAENAAVALSPRAGRTDCLHVMTSAAHYATPALPSMAGAALSEIVARIRAAGGNGEAMVAETAAETVSEAIARMARERDCSLIVVGRHGQGRVESMLIGSTAAKLCEIAGRPVLLVP